MKEFKERFKPMLLEQVKEPFNSKNYIFEIKFDGIRALIYATKTTLKIYNRHNVEITLKYPELQKIKKIVTKPTIFDGEITLFQNGVPNFAKLEERINLKKSDKIKIQSEENPVIFVAFDLLWEGKEDLSELPLMKRKKRLQKYPDTDVFLKTFYIDTEGIKLFQKTKAKKLEGIVAKKKESIYEKNKRSDSWLKIKHLEKEKFLIGGYKENLNTPFFSLILGEKKENKLYYVGKVSVAKKYQIYQKIKKQAKRKTSPFFDFQEEGIIFINPKLSCLITYLERSKKGILRHPVYIKER